MDIESLKNEIKRREKANSFAPFPVYDTGDIEKLKNKLERSSVIRTMPVRNSFNDDPITYCKTCLSIAVKITSVDKQKVDYCSNCGNTDIGVSHISEWSDSFEDKHGYNYLKGKE